MYDDLVALVQSIYRSTEFIALHEPTFQGNEKKYVNHAIESTFVSSVGSLVDDFAKRMAEYTGVKHAIATVNGTAALHLALLQTGADAETEVLTQSLSFVATANSIKYCGASPVFVDVDKDTLGMSPHKLRFFLEENCEIRDDGLCWNVSSNKKILSCIVMHTFGFPARTKELKKVCDEFNLVFVEDTAESLGSFYDGDHTGMLSGLSATSFNGNKIITTGGGGMILTNDEDIAARARHQSTTARIKHDWFIEHDEIGFNYRMPNLNAALGLAQLELLDDFLDKKRWVAKKYQEWGKIHDVMFVSELPGMKANYWLNTIITQNLQERDALLEYTNSKGVQTRPIWTPMHKLDMYKSCQKTSMETTEWLCDRVVNVPSSVIKYEIQ
jgi:perosamine synthetase